MTQTPIGKIIDFDKQWSLIIMRPEILANIYIYFEGDIVYIEDSKKNRHPVVIGAVSKQNQKISLIDNNKNLSQLLSTYKIGDLVYDTRKDLAKEKKMLEKAAKDKAAKEKAAKEKAAKEKAYKEKKMLEKAAKDKAAKEKAAKERAELNKTYDLNEINKERLKDLKELFEEELINEQEYNQKKQEILDQL